MCYCSNLFLGVYLLLMVFAMFGIYSLVASFSGVAPQG